MKARDLLINQKFIFSGKSENVYIARQKRSHKKKLNEFQIRYDTVSGPLHDAEMKRRQTLRDIGIPENQVASNIAWLSGNSNVELV